MIWAPAAGGWHNNQYYFSNKEFQSLFDKLNEKKGN